jgi:hypothetical protein
MASANTNYTDVLATTIENRSKKIQDNVTNNNAFLKKMSMGGRQRTFSGGHKIVEELAFAENSNAGWYSGYDLLPVSATDVISASEFNIKQAAVPVVISGLEQLQNMGKEQMIDLLEGRMTVAEATFNNLLSAGIYSDGVTPTTKQIDGLAAALTTSPTTGTYGNISRATWTFWRHIYSTSTSAIGAAASATNVNSLFNWAWSQLVRGADRPDLILVDNTMWRFYAASLQALQRYASADSAGFGFPTLKYMDADVVLDGGIYAQAGTGGTGTFSNSAVFLNTKYFSYRPHAKRNVVALSPNKRYATNQDAEVQIMAWAGNVTCSGLMFQARLSGA